MKVGIEQEWRGISQGEVVGPDNAFNYMRKSMHQTLPAIMGALNLLADSFTAPQSDEFKEEQQEAPEAGPELLHANAYDLYTRFRPSTAGEWGKKSFFYCAKALALRRGRQSDVDQWEEAEETRLKQPQEEAFEQELNKLVKMEGEPKEETN